MGEILVNPGASPQEGTLEQARANLEAFLQEAGLEGAEIHRSADWWDRYKGLYGFTVTYHHQSGSNSIIIEIPGLPLEQVRYMNLSGQKIMDFPRLLVNGDSGVWEFSLETARHYLDREHQETEEERAQRKQEAYIADLRERLQDLKGQLLSMQTRAIEAEKALAGAETSTTLAKEDLQRANEQLADARRLLNQWRMMAEERVTWPEHQERTLRETRAFLGMEADDGN